MNNLEKRCANKKQFAYPMLGSVFLGISFLSLFLLTACTLQTDEEILIENGKKPPPYVFHTSKYYYLNWPKHSVVREKELIAEPVKFKVPVIYLQGNTPSYDSISIRLLPDAKPYLFRDNVKLERSKKASPSDLKRIGNEWDESFSTSINMDSNFEMPHMQGGAGEGSVAFWREHGTLAGLKRFISTECFDMNAVNENIWEKVLNVLKVKAEDDDSPANCREYRIEQLFFPLSETQTPFFIKCYGQFCMAYANFKGRVLEIQVSKKNSAYHYQNKMAKKYTQTQLNNMRVAELPEPLLTEVYTDLPQWEAKVIPTIMLYERFIYE